VTDYRPYVSGAALPRCWLGVRFKDTTPSTPSIVLPNPSFPFKREDSKDSKVEKGEIGYTENMDGVDVDEEQAKKRSNFASKAEEIIAEKKCEECGRVVSVLYEIGKGISCCACVRSATMRIWIT